MQGTMLVFKRFTFLIALIFIVTAASATDPIKKTKPIFKSPSLSLNVHSAETSEMIMSSSYNLSNDKLELTLKEEVAFIEVIKNENGEVEFQIPVEASKIYLNLGQFEKGSYSINLLSYDKSSMIAMDLDKQK